MPPGSPPWAAASPGRDPSTLLKRLWRHDLLRRSGTTFLVNMTGLAVAAGAQLMLARALGAAEYGFYSYAFAWLSVTSLIATAGFQPGVVRFGAVYASRGEDGLLRRISSFATRASLIVSGVLVACCLVALWLYGDGLQDGFLQSLWIVLLITPIVALKRIAGSQLRVRDRLMEPLVAELCVREIGVLAFAALTLAGVIGHQSAAGAMTAVLIVSAASLLFLHVRLAGLPPVERTRPGAAPASPRPVRDWLVPSAHLLLFATANLLQKRSDILILGALLNTTYAGIYSIAVYVAGLVNLPQTAIAFVLAPEVARLHARDAVGELRNRAMLAAWSTFLSASVAGLAIWMAAPIVLSAMGPQFEAATWPLRILVLGHVLNSSFGCLELLMTMTGDERRAARLLVAVTAANLPLMWLWISLGGLAGAALGTVGAVFAFKLACCVMAYRRTGVVSSILSVGRCNPLSPRGA